jgi:hypothetical protein
MKRRGFIPLEFMMRVKIRLWLTTIEAVLQVQTTEARRERVNGTGIFILYIILRNEGERLETGLLSCPSQNSER